MRGLLLPFAGWMGALQALVPHTATADDTARLIGVASVLGTLTVLIYRLGVWRQEMENTKHNVGAEVKAYREESTVNFDRLERRLEAIDHLMASSSEHRIRAVRWQARTDRRLDMLEHSTAERVE
jgi:hypothetical protein